MNVAVGTSGFAYKEWKGSFYPADLKNDDMLRFYGERFRAVEINSTFYRMPKEQVLLNWAAQVPDGFTFVLKAPQRITHFKRLNDVGEDLGYFLKVATVLAERRGPTLFQLPPNMKKDLPRLVAFLELVPNRWRAAFEFRHVSWYDDDVYEALKAKNAALCAADTDDDPARLVATADWGYARLRRLDYDSAALSTWANRFLSQPWLDLYVFFKHEDDPSGPRFAAEFMQMTATSTPA